jgi:hypothetical protein
MRFRSSSEEGRSGVRTRASSRAAFVCCPSVSWMPCSSFSFPFQQFHLELQLTSRSNSSHPYSSLQNDMLMTYHNYTNTAVGRQALDYTQTFLSRLQARTPSNPLNGSFSFDFILSQDQKLYIIECNPRVHTACTLLPPLSFAKALLDVIPASTLPITPLPSTLPRSWVSHDLIVRLLPRLIPKGLRATIHPWLDQTVDERQGQGESWWWRDPMFDWEDPVPFLVLGHGQVVLLLWNCLVKKRKRWTRINVSTARVFEC